MKKLKAIMFTDIIGFTSLSDSDRENALEIQRSNLKMHKDLITRHKGQLVNDMGDGVLASFDSAEDAVGCAIDLQTGLQNADYQIRIGVDLGDVDTRDQNLIGPVTNIASRIQELGSGQSVLISSRVRDQVASRIDINLLSLGPRILKNVSDPQHIYAITSDILQVPDISDTTLPSIGQALSEDARTILVYLDQPAIQMLGGAIYLQLNVQILNQGLLDRALVELIGRGFAQKVGSLFSITHSGIDFLH